MGIALVSHDGGLLFESGRSHPSYPAVNTGTLILMEVRKDR